jgi:lipopolysaccharide biosynthesis protein
MAQEKRTDVPPTRSIAYRLAVRTARAVAARLPEPVIDRIPEHLVERLRPAPPYVGPAAFDDWVIRRGTERVPLYPDGWRTRPGVTVENPALVAVALHVYYADLLPELLEQLEHIPVEFDLIVTNSSGTELSIPSTVGRMRNSRVLDIENRGRDIWPTVAAVNSGVLDPYLLILKVHTKQSAWRSGHAQLAGDGDTWRASFIKELLGSRENVVQILNAFRHDSSLGVVTADGSVLGPEFWGDNEATTHQLARRLEMTVDDRTLVFAAGSMYWCRGLVLQGLRSLNMSQPDFEEEAGQQNATTAHAVERLIGLATAEAGLRTVERSAAPSGSDDHAWEFFHGGRLTPRARFVPFYLPQFHPFPENDAWWGRGFTEWTNVTTAKPVYHGHDQPKLPTDLGFYDLRLDETRTAQAELASFAGVEGFMYYYYWFSGRRLMSRPIEALKNSDLDFPFCIMWANENWTRRWDGEEDDVLLGQDYDAHPASQFMEDILEFLHDPRYLTIDGRKVVAVYKPAQMADFAEVAKEWRQIARKAGLGEIFLMNVDVGESIGGLHSPEEAGLDGALGFPPHNSSWSWVNGADIGVRGGFTGMGMSYPVMADAGVEAAWRRLARNYYPGAMVTFDNTPRRPMSSHFWYGSNPYVFHRWLHGLVTGVSDRDREHRVIFLNAWNEWAEGAVLEPSNRHGRGYLNALRAAAFS